MIASYFPSLTLRTYGKSNNYSYIIIVVYMSSCIACLVILSHFLFVCIFKSHAFPVLHSLVCHLSLCSLSVCMSLCTLNKIFTSVTVLARIDLPLAS